MSDTARAYKAYGYRWVILIAFVSIAVMTQVLWITFAPVTGAAARFYHTSDLMIGLLAMSFMIVYILLFFPAAYAIDTWGFRKAVGFGAVLTALFGLCRGLFASDFTIVCLSQFGLAVGQPFVISAITKVAARWFPAGERATASALGTLSLYLGPLIAMFLTPYLTLRLGLPHTLLVYGIAAAAAAAFFLAAAREHPPTPAGEEARVLMFEGLKSMLRRRDFLFLMIMFFIGLGMFNSVSTWIENIVRPRGFGVSRAGALGGVLLAGGIVGAVIVSLLSDHYRSRKPFIVLAMAGLIPGLLGITYATSYALLLISGFVFGFFLLSAGPIGFQYAAEITHPAPEATSNTLLLVMGQVSGIIFVLGMDALKAPGSGAMTAPLVVLAGLGVGSAILALFVAESPVHGRL